MPFSSAVTPYLPHLSYTCNYDVYRIDTVKGIATCIAYFPSVGGAVLNSTGTYIYSTHPDMSWISIYRL
ncbi:Uncharacterized protein ALO80_02720 [Pseudomonas caricapapayae]|uniref:Uncharacterized protein n=1 Tax=Pseudomonas caricapapayae TaxID=46678 RepID=A0A0P9LJX3_9PSED|nr:Uncharacterized protein ALO80_02720 [Pseudomonas caricapapayae]RMM08847.1 hypothetical protein ALQ84_04455 [Pseudomonas caricapapayae]